MTPDVSAYNALATTMRELCVKVVRLRRLAQQVRPAETGPGALLPKVPDSQIQPLKRLAEQLGHLVDRACEEEASLPIAPSHERMIEYRATWNWSYTAGVVNVALPASNFVLASLRWKGGQSPGRWREVCDRILDVVPSGVDWANEVLTLIRHELNAAAKDYIRLFPELLSPTSHQSAPWSAADDSPPGELPEQRAKQLAAILWQHHFQSDGTSIEGVRPLTVKEVKQCVEQSNEGKPVNGWSEGSTRLLFQRLLKDGYSGYKNLSSSARGLRYLRKRLEARMNYRPSKE